MARPQRFTGLAPCVTLDVRDYGSPRSQVRQLFLPSSLRTQGPIPRNLSAFALNEDALFYIVSLPSRPVAMGPCVRRDDGETTSSPRSPSPAAPDRPRAAARRRVPPRCR